MLLLLHLLLLFTCLFRGGLFFLGLVRVDTLEGSVLLERVVIVGSGLFIGVFDLHDRLGVLLELGLVVVLVVVGQVVIETGQGTGVLDLLLLHLARDGRDALHLLLLQKTGVVGGVYLLLVQFVDVLALVLLDVDEVGDGHVGGGPLERGLAGGVQLAGQFLLDVF